MIYIYILYHIKVDGNSTLPAIFKITGHDEKTRNL